MPCRVHLLVCRLLLLLQLLLLLRMTLLHLLLVLLLQILTLLYHLLLQVLLRPLLQWQLVERRRRRAVGNGRILLLAFCAYSFAAQRRRAECFCGAQLGIAVREGTLIGSLVAIPLAELDAEGCLRQIRSVFDLSLVVCIRAVLPVSALACRIEAAKFSFVELLAEQLPPSTALRTAAADASITAGHARSAPVAPTRGLPQPRRV